MSISDEVASVWIRPRNVALVTALALAGCGKSDEQPKQAPPPPTVLVTTVQPQSVPNNVELPGRIQAVRSVEVRARTDGIILRRVYDEGSDIRAGQVLFTIDPRDKRAALQQAQAALARVVATQHNARSVVERYRPLVSRRAVSEQEFDAALSDQGQADAQVSDARAALTRASLELGYTTVRAPISGRVGRAEVTEGALVTSGQGTLLTRVDQLSPVYAVFAQSDAQTLDFIQQRVKGQVSLPSPRRVPVRLVLDNGADYALTGYIDFSDQAVAEGTGTRILRATFPNPARLLLPGQLVRGRISGGLINNVFMVPSRAVQVQDQKGTLTVVGKDGTAQTRQVSLGGQSAGSWIIKDGLRAGDAVIVEGWQKVQPGQKVNAKPYRASAQGQASTPAARR